MLDVATVDEKRDTPSKKRKAKNALNDEAVACNIRMMPQMTILPPKHGFEIDNHAVSMYAYRDIWLLGASVKCTPWGTPTQDTLPSRRSD